MTPRRKPRQRLGWAFRLCVVLLRPPLMLLSKRRWAAAEKLPATGGCVVVTNHVSHIDPLTLAHFLYDNGRLVRFLTKRQLFDVPLLGRLLTSLAQIPVERLSTRASGATDAAAAAVRNGELVLVYPEGTITRDPQLWPMVGKTGAARIALVTGCPVIPTAQWGPQEIYPAYGRRVHLLPRRTVQVMVGDPVDLSDLYDEQPTAEVLRQATDRIMSAVTGLLEQLRGETAPTQRFDPRTAGVPQVGNPRQRSTDTS